MPEDSSLTGSQAKSLLMEPSFAITVTLTPSTSSSWFDTDTSLESESPRQRRLRRLRLGLGLGLHQLHPLQKRPKRPLRSHHSLCSLTLSLVLFMMLTTMTTARTSSSASASATAHLQQTYSVRDAVLHLSGGESASAKSSPASTLNPLKLKEKQTQTLKSNGAATTTNSILSNKLTSKLPNVKQSVSALKTKVADKVEDAVDVIQTTTTTTAPATAEIKEDPRMKVLIRLLFLMYYGSLGSLMPYLPVYYHHLGHGGQIIGLLGAVKPFTTFLVAPVWGLIADQTQNPFLILQVTFIVSLLGQLLVSVRTDAYFITVMVFLTALFNAPVKSLMDSMVMDHIRPESYGRLRLWGQMGFGIGSSLVGFALSKSSNLKEWPETTTFTDTFQETLLSNLPVFLYNAVNYADKCWQSLTGYKLLFFTYAGLSIPTWLCIQAFRRLDRERQESRTTSAADKSSSAAQKVKSVFQPKKAAAPVGARIGEGLRLLVTDSDALLFFFLVFVVGISSGMIENFAYVRMREVGGTGKEMGLSRLVSSLAGAPMFWFSGPLTEALGADRVIVFSLLSYCLRFVIYAFMRNPYHGLPAEALRGVTFAAFWSTGTIYAHRVSPPGLHATMLMILNAMYGGLGQSLGAIIGGKMQHRFGTVNSFLYAAAVDFVFVCGVIVYLSIRKDSSFKNPKPIVAKERKIKAP